MRATLAAFILAPCLSCGVAMADATIPTLDGLVKRPLQLSAQVLDRLPPTELEAAFQTGHGRQVARYKGITLWALLQQAGVAAAGEKHESFRHYLLVTGRDGYAVAVAMGEIDPELEGKQVIVAYARDGKPLEKDGLRLIVPGDRRGGRAVRDVVHIELK